MSSWHDNLVFFVNGKLKTTWSLLYLDFNLTILLLGVRYCIKNPDLDKCLVEFLRTDLGLCGTKVGCGNGGCGSCTVTLSKRDWQEPGRFVHLSINACKTKLVHLHGAAITTVEGLGSPATKLHPVQERIYKSHGSQCGFCTPGMVMSMSAMLRTKSVDKLFIDIEDVDKCLQGNLCRCTGYRPILEGFRTFCQEKDERQASDPTMNADDFMDYNSDKDDPTIPKEMLSHDFDREPLHFQNEETSRHFWRPVNLNEMDNLFRVLGQNNCQVVQGGTGTYKVKTSNPKNLISLSAIQELKSVALQDDGNKLTIGAGVSLSEAAKIFGQVDFGQPFVRALSTLASPQVRNVATIGGSLMWPHPSSDLWPLYLAFNATADILSMDGWIIKDKPVGQLVRRSGQNGHTDDPFIVISVSIANPGPHSMAIFERKARRKEFDLSILNMAAVAKLDKESGQTIEDITIVFGGTSHVFSLATKSTKRPSFALKVMDLLKGQPLKTAMFTEGLREAIEEEIQESDDIETPGDLKTLRLSLALYFLKKFLNGNKEENKCPGIGLKGSKQVFQTVTIGRDEQPGHDLVHRPIPHMWAAEQACGTAIYLDDMAPLKGELQIVLVRSSARAKARIKSMDFGPALSIDGVVGVISAKDLDPKKNTWGHILRDEEIFASETVHYNGQVIAALTVKDKQLGQLAAKKVRIEYEPIEEEKGVLNLKDAQDKGIDLDTLEVLKSEHTMDRIQEPSWLENKTGQLIQGQVRSGAQEHFYLEPTGALVIPSTEKDELVVYSTSQEPCSIQAELSKLLGIPANRIEVKVKRLGGAFGGKERMHTTLICALAARKFARPCRLVLNRLEDMDITGARHEAVTDYEILVDRESGRILDAKFKVYANAGCSADYTYPWTLLFMVGLGGGYTLKNASIVGKAVKTQAPSHTAFRGFGWPEAGLVIETVMDRIAHDLEMDPVIVREANMTREGDLLHHSDARLKGVTLETCWKTCLEQSHYEEKIKECLEFNKANRDVKRGLAIVPMKFPPGMKRKGSMRGTALVHVYKDGSVLLSHGGVEMGQGLTTKMIQVASRALDISAKLIHTKETSSATVANASPTSASCGTDLNGPAVVDACQQIQDRLKPYKDKCPNGQWTDWIKAALENRVNLTAVGHYDSSPFVHYVGKDGKHHGNFFAYHTYGAGSVQVEVNCQTGDVSVLSTDIVMDLGKSLNPAIDIGQIEGAFLQVLGFATNEQLVRDKRTGKLVSNGPGNYCLPTVADVPHQFNVTLINDESKESNTSAVYSSKGVGEPPSCMASAILLAIKDAVASYRRDHGNNAWFSLEAPATADKIRQAALDDLVKSCNTGTSGSDSVFLEM